MPDRHFGCIIDHADTDRLLGDLPHPLFGAAAHHLDDSGDGKLSLPYISMLKFTGFDVFAEEAQTTGDCVSHGCRTAADISRAVEIDIRGEPEEWKARGATEPIYGAREHYGQGMSPSVASRYVHEHGLVARGKYDDIDLSTYNSLYGIRWGNGRIPDEILNEADKHPVKTISLVTTVEEARDALANGYGLHIGSGQGFLSKRNEIGFCQPHGSWNHNMAVVGCTFKREHRPGFVLANSWGDYVNGGHPYWGKLPPGCFLCGVETFTRMLRSRGCWALSDVEGFPARKLPDYGAGEFL